MQLSLLMVDLGFSPKLKGFRYLHDAVCIAENNNLSHLCEVFSLLAKKQNVSPRSIESNLRTLIKNAHDSKNLMKINDYLYPAKAIDEKYPPTACEIVALLDLITRYKIPNYFGNAVLLSKSGPINSFNN